MTFVGIPCLIIRDLAYPSVWRSNAFANRLPAGHNIYAFPPFVLLGPLLNSVLIKIFMVASHLSCRICDRGRFGGRLFRLSLLTVCCFARRDLPPCCFFLPETHVSGFCATYSGISGLSEAFLRGHPLLFFSRFQGLGSLFSDVQHVYTQTTLTLTFVKLVVRVCRAPLKSLVCHARLWTIHGYLDVS